jgi:predicted DNA-binding transcriptional regulator AlpA
MQKLPATYHGDVSFKKAHIMARPTPPSIVPDALKHFDSLPDSANVRQPVVEALFGCSGSTVWRMVKRKTLPAPRKLSDRISAWNVGELRRKLDRVDQRVCPQSPKQSSIRGEQAFTFTNPSR